MHAARIWYLDYWNTTRLPTQSELLTTLLGLKAVVPRFLTPLLFVLVLDSPRISSPILSCSVASLAGWLRGYSILFCSLSTDHCSRHVSHSCLS